MLISTNAEESYSRYRAKPAALSKPRCITPIMPRRLLYDGSAVHAIWSYIGPMPRETMKRSAMIDKKGRVVFRVYLSKDHISFIKRIADNQSITQSEAMRRVIDQLKAQVER